MAFSLSGNGLRRGIQISEWPLLPAVIQGPRLLLTEASISRRVSLGRIAAKSRKQSSRKERSVRRGCACLLRAGAPNTDHLLASH